MTLGCRVSLAPPHLTLPTFLNLHDSSNEHYDFYNEAMLRMEKNGLVSVIQS